MKETPVVVTELEYGKAEREFRTAPGFAVRVSGPSEADVAAAVKAAGAKAVVLGVAPYVGELYDALPRGGVIARFGLGTDGIDKERATATGLYVINTPGVLEDAVAEHVFALLLALAKNLAKYAAPPSSAAWAPEMSWELRGKTLAVIGCGAIGRRVAKIAARAFGMCVVGQDVTTDAADQLRDQWGFDRVTDDFGEAVREADVVSLHIPGTAANRHFVCDRTLALLPATAVLVNTARGSIVDEVALFDALAAGKLAGAALDVFESEPYVPRASDKDLRTLPNVFTTPHVSAATHEACARAAAAVLGGIASVLRGDIGAVSLVNPAVLTEIDRT